MNGGYYITSEGNKVEFEDSINLHLSYKDIVELNISNCINLEYLYCHNNQLTYLDLSNNINLKWLYCKNNQLTQLDLSNNIKLEYLDCDIKTKPLNFNNNKTTINFM